MASDYSYLELYYEKNTCLWNKWILQVERNCDSIERQLHILAKQLNIEKEKNSKNKERIVHYALVDYHPDIIAMRNYLSDTENYIVENKIDTDKMTTDFLLMMALRDRHAKKAGYASYASMILSLEGIEIKTLKQRLNDRLNHEIEMAKDLIKKYNLKLDNWYTGLRAIECGSGVNHIMLMDRVMNYFPEAYGNVKIERHTCNKAGYASELKPGEIHINIERVDTLFDMNVFFHEMGHGIAHAYDDSVGLDRIYSNFYEELTGVIMERYLGHMLRESHGKCLDEIRILQYVRFAIEALYELELWFSDTSPEDLFRAHYQRIIESDEEMSIGLRQALRLSEPLYMYNYILADIAAEKIIAEGPSKLKELARYLVEEVFSHGVNKDWIEFALRAAKEID